MKNRKKFSMKKFLLYSVLIVLFNSCAVFSFLGNMAKEPSALKQIDFCFKGMKMMKKTEQTYYYGQKFPFILDENAMFIPCKINDTIYLVCYDSDMSGMSVKHGFLQEKIPYNAELPKSNKTVKLKEKTDSKEKILMKSGLKYYDIASDFFQIKNLVGVATSASNDTIISEYGSEKTPFTIGQDALFNWANTMILSFSDTTITLLDSNNTYDTTGFTLIKSLHTCRGRTICLTIDSIEYAFLFKTGYKEFLSLQHYGKSQNCVSPDKCDYFYVDYESHKKENDTYMVSFKDTMIVQQTNAVTMGGFDSITGNILYSNKITHPVMGMAFISQFDWIIDMNKEKIYAKKIKE